jgi:hypothetical protein
VRLLVGELAPALPQLGRVDEHLPLGTPEAAVAHALTPASGFDVSSVLNTAAPTSATATIRSTMCASCSPIRSSRHG